jgi:hypothetical protein
MRPVTTSLLDALRARVALLELRLWEWGRDNLCLSVDEAIAVSRYIGVLTWTIKDLESHA